MIEITETMREQVRAAVGSSLSAGLGTPEHHCVMAAVSLALDGRLLADAVDAYRKAGGK